MIKPIIHILLIGNGSVTIERKKNGTKFYTAVSRSSITRLHKAVSNVVNQRYSPKITLFNGGYEVEW